jgi:hypothetical protein
MAWAQSDMERVIVPDKPQGVIVSGCYKARSQLYGPYNFSFCLKKKATYAVRGNGIQCDGKLDWAKSGKNINVDVRRTSCNRGKAWAAANMSCRPLSPLQEALLQILDQGEQAGGLRCTYDPSVPGETNRSFLAVRY